MPGTSGIGFAAAEAFVKECATVFISGRDRDRGARAQAYLRTIAPGGCRAAPRPATFAAADVRNLTAMKALVKAAGDFQIAINNAGVGGYGVRRLVDVDEALLADALFAHDPIGINLRGLVISMHAELNHWEARCGAAKTPEACSRVMVVTGSISGQVSSPRTAVYAATKAAANSLCRSGERERVCMRAHVCVGPDVCKCTHLCQRVCASLCACRVCLHPCCKNLCASMPSSGNRCLAFLA